MVTERAGCLGRAPGLQEGGNSGEGTGEREWFPAGVGPPTGRGLQ